MKLPIPSILSVAALVLCASPLSAADAVELRQQWQVGKKYFQSMKMEQGSTINIGGQKMEQKMNMTMEMTASVKKHEDGRQKRLTVRYDRAAISMNMNGQEMGYDTAKPDAGTPAMGKAFDAMIGKDLKVLANEKDEITGIENFDEFFGGGAGLLGGQLGQMMNKESLIEMMKQGALKSVPGKPVVPGDSWPFGYTTKMPQIGQIGFKGTYTYKRMSPRGGVPCLEIAIDGNMNIDLGAAAGGDAAKPDGSAAVLSALGMKMTGGKMTGTVWFDPALGMVRDADFTQEMSITMKNPAEPGAVLTIPMKQTISQKLTKVEDVK